MKLTGKCKEAFENWYSSQDLWEIKYFYTLNINFRYGVYIDFFQSVGININVVINKRGTYNSWCSLINDWDIISRALPTQKCINEARTQTVLEANELYKNS